MRTAETVLNIIRGSFHVEITGKRRDTETVMRRLEGAIGKVLAMVTRWSPTLPHARFCRPAEWATAPLSLTIPLQDKI
jgi:hypothetical protein